MSIVLALLRRGPYMPEYVHVYLGNQLQGVGPVIVTLENSFPRWLV